MKRLRFISLFAGIGGFDLGFERSGMECVAQVEINKNALKTLAHHWQNVARFEDVKEVGKHNLPECDVICGGFPCQGLSIAGLRKGLSDVRSGLFYEMTRITDECRPSILVWENVPGLLSSNSGRDFLAVLMELERIGYCGCWTTLDARFFGLAQRRRRIFGVFARRDIGAERCTQILSLDNRLHGNTSQSRKAGKDNRFKIAGSLKSGSTTRDASCASANHIIDIRNMVTSDISHTLQAKSSGGYSLNYLPVVTGTLTARAMQSYGREMVEEGFTIAFSHSDNGRDATANLSPTLRASNNVNGNMHGNGHLSIVQCIKGAAIGRKPEAGPQYGEVIENQSYTLNATEVHAVNHANSVRRVTPVECERLQGFPDDFTAMHSDSVRYMLLGNAVAVPVVEWIGEGIVRTMSEVTP